MIEPATIAGVAGLSTTARRRGEILAADEHVDQAVVVVVAPGGRLGRDRLGQAAGDRDVVEAAVPLVPQQREPQRRLPGAAQQQDVEIAVVVEIGAGDVQGVDLVAETGRGRPILERAVTTVDEQRGTQVGVERGGEEVGQAVAVEIVEDAAAGQVRPPRRPGPTSDATFSNRPTSASERNSSTGNQVFVAGPFRGTRPASCRRCSRAR